MIFLRLLCGSLLQLIPFAFLCFYPFKNHLRLSKKKTVCITALLLLMLSLVFSVICCYMKEIYPPSQELFLYANGVFMCCLIPCMIWYLYAVQEAWQKKLFIFSFAMTSALAMTSVDTVIETRLQLPNLLSGVADGLPYAGSAILTLAVLTALVLPLLWLLLKYYYLPVADSMNKKDSGNLSVLSILLFVVLASGLVPLNNSKIYNPASLTLYFTLLIAVFIIYFVYFQMFYHAHTKLAVQQKLVHTQHQLELRDEQYRRITNNIENSRRMRHDLRHHMVAIQGFLNTSRVEETRNYVSQYVNSLNEYEVVKLCENAVIDMIVSYYKALAKEKDLDFTIHIDIPKEISIQNSDISVLIGNLLENAIDAASHALEEHRYIYLNIICSGKMIAITVDNGFDGKLKMKEYHYVSSKKQHIGVGLQSIEGIAEKYNGGVEFTHEEFVFHSSVMLRIE